VRSHARDLVAAKPFGAIDMELFRKCPCPVLVVGPGALRTEPQIVGAVDASAENPVERELNVTIVELTLMMARLEQGSAKLLHAWAPFAAELVRSHGSESDFAAYVEAAHRQASQDLEQLVASIRERHVEATLLQGHPEDVIPEFVVAHGVDLVVMGTVARRGVAGLLIGNTAERVLRKLPCSVLAVKPDGFVTPVRLDASGE
jgi:nucleotide-binding universal stress UspA family protein